MADPVYRLQHKTMLWAKSVNVTTRAEAERMRDAIPDRVRRARFRIDRSDDDGRTWKPDDGR